jgi:hypothetical protein
VEDLLEAISGGMDCQGPTGKNLAWCSNETVQTAQAEFDRHQPDVVVGSSRGGAVAMNIHSGELSRIMEPFDRAGVTFGWDEKVELPTVM